METFWICGKCIAFTYRKADLNIEPEICWEFAGCFSTEEKAIEACVDENYFIGPIKIDEKVPVDSSTWEGAYYPKHVANDCDCGCKI